jgi:hypothetical protein
MKKDKRNNIYMKIWNKKNNCQWKKSLYCWHKQKFRKKYLRQPSIDFDFCNTKDWVTRTPPKFGGEHMCSGKISSSSSTSDTRPVTLVTNPVISLKSSTICAFSRSIDFDFCNISSTCDVVYKGPDWHMLVTDLFYDFVSILLVWVVKASINAYQINRKSLTMKNLLKIVFVYVGGFVKLSAHVWPIFDCYSNMPLVVYRILFY